LVKFTIMKDKKKHINSNLTIRVDHPSSTLLKFVRDLKVRKEAKKKELTPSN